MLSLTKTNYALITKLHSKNLFFFVYILSVFLDLDFLYLLIMFDEVR